MAATAPARHLQYRPCPRKSNATPTVAPVPYSLKRTRERDGDLACLGLSLCYGLAACPMALGKARTAPKRLPRIRAPPGNAPCHRRAALAKPPQSKSSIWQVAANCIASCVNSPDVTANPSSPLRRHDAAKLPNHCDADFLRPPMLTLHKGNARRPSSGRDQPRRPPVPADLIPVQPKSSPTSLSNCRNSFRSKSGRRRCRHYSTASGLASSSCTRRAQVVDSAAPLCQVNSFSPSGNLATCLAAAVIQFTEACQWAWTFPDEPRIAARAQAPSEIHLRMRNFALCPR